MKEDMADLKILILEDIPEDAELVRRALAIDQLNFSCHVVDDRDSFILALEAFGPDVILSDHTLPQFNSLEALSILKEKINDVPFILVTGSVSEEFAVSCLKLGADDYILKSNLTRLPLAIKNALEKHELERQRKVNEDFLRRQNEELIRINQELDAFVYSVSHNLRSPLAAVAGIIDLAKEELIDQNKILPVYLDMIEVSIGRLDKTLMDILDYSRNARLKLKLERFDLDVLVNEAYSELKYLPGGKNIKFEVEVNEEVPFLTDVFRFKMIVSNLLSNAIKYSLAEEGRSYITVKAHVTSAMLRFEVADNGIGIGAGYLDKIFRMFYRASNMGDGAGLGLYIVKQVIEKMNGTISVSSDAIHGTVFVVEIPNFSSDQASLLMEESE